MSLGRLGTIFGMDLRFHATRPLIWILLLILALTSFGLSSGNMQIQSGDSTVGGQSKVWMTSEFTVAMVLPLVAFLFYVFFIAVGAGMIIPRDDEVNVGPVLHATRLRPSEYIGGKFFAALTVFLFVLALHLLFQIFFNHFWPHANVEEIRGPFQLVNYLRPALLLALPCVVFFCGASFAIGEFTRRPLLVIVTPLIFFLVGVFFLFDWSPAWLDPRINNLLMWIEPSGYRWINETWLRVDRGVDFYNLQPVIYDTPFLLSRLAYVVLGFGLVGLAGRHFATNLRGTRKTKSRKKLAAPEATAAPVWGKRLATLGMTATAPGFLRTVLDVARFEARNLWSQPGLYLFIPIILIQTIGSLSFDVGAFDTPLLLTSGLAAVRTMNTLTLLVCFLLLFYTVESVVREWNTRLAPIFYATPGRTGAILLGKAIANGIVGAVILLAAFLGVVGVMLYQGRVQVELQPFLLVWGALLLPTFVVWASFVMAALAITGSRYLTYGIGLAVIAFTGWKQSRGEVNWVGNWNLWGATTWTDFGGIEPNGFALLLNRLFWVAVLGILVALTVRVFPRREHDSAGIVDRLRPAFVGKTLLRLTPVLVPALVIGSFLFLQVQKGFQGDAQEKADKDYWRRNVEEWKNADVPELADVDLDLTLDPKRNFFAVTGSYVLENPTEEPMRRFPMTVGSHFENVTWKLEGEPFEPEDRSGLFVFELDEPLAPGDQVSVGFSHEGRFPRGVTKNGGGMANFILPSGVVLTSFNTGFIPLPAFEDGRGVDEENQTEPSDWEDDFWVGKTPPGLGTGARYSVRTKITGPAEYAYHGVGVKTDESVTDGMRTVVWQSDFPVNFFNVVAGKWDVWEGEGATVYYHPKHTYNIEEIGAALVAARKNYSRWFYPYPWRELRLNEFPGLASYAQGFPTNITFSESIGFLTRSRPESQVAFMVTAHEAAHQWWGNILMPGDGPGGNILSEGMAHFSTALLVGEEVGFRERIEFCKLIEDRYGERRQVDSERALVWIDGSKAGDTTVTYDKGGWVFWMLHHLLGAETSFAATRDFVGRYARSDDFPVLQDYVAVMREHAPDPEAFDAFVDQWFFDVVVPEFRVENTRVEGGGGEWIVTADVENVGTGEVQVEVAAERGERFPEEDVEAEAWRDARTTIRLGAGERMPISIETDFEPERIVVDPDVLQLMLQRDQATVSL